MNILPALEQLRIYFDFSLLKGKKVLLVNTASNYGYTNQYDDLQKLYHQFENKLAILGFPPNAAKNGWNNQEPTWNFSKYLYE